VVDLNRLSVLSEILSGGGDEWVEVILLAL
jgi:hypothetical protein